MLSARAIFNIIFLPLIIFIGIVTSYEDFKISKIRNKWIILGVAYALVIYLLSWISYWLALKKIIIPLIGGVTSYLVWNFDKWCINLIISILVAYFLWYFKIWAAGDAKLFICYAALIPMGQYSKVYLHYYFASFFLLLVIFIPPTVFIFLCSSIYFIKRFSLDKVRKKVQESIGKLKFNKAEAGKILLGFFIFFLCFKIVRQKFQNLMRNFLPDQNILLLLSLLFFKQLSKIFKKNVRLLLIAFLISVIYISYNMLYSWNQLVLEIGSMFSRAMSVMILFPVFKKITKAYAERVTQKTTPFAHWMFLGALIAWFI